jgi:hypothetical protein
MRCVGRDRAWADRLTSQRLQHGLEIAALGGQPTRGVRHRLAHGRDGRRVGGRGRVAVKSVRCRRSSRIRRAAICGSAPTSSAGSSVTARPDATSAPRTSPSSLRWRTSGSKPPSRLQTLRTTASSPVPGWPAAQMSVSVAPSPTGLRLVTAG